MLHTRWVWDLRLLPEGGFADQGSLTGKRISTILNDIIFFLLFFPFRSLILLSILLLVFSKQKGREERAIAGFFVTILRL